MNKEQFLGEWNTFKGKARQQWGKLTDDDIAQINGKREELIGRLQKRYGYAKEKAEEEVSHFEQSLHATAGAGTRTEKYSSNERQGTERKGMDRQNPSSERQTKDWNK